MDINSFCGKTCAKNGSPISNSLVRLNEEQIAQGLNTHATLCEANSYQ
jgi:hypothetical protein